MSGYRPIAADHPYIKTVVDNESDWHPSDMDQVFQLEGELWPIYSLHVMSCAMPSAAYHYSPNVGFSISINLKRDMKSCWCDCSLFEPVPCGLAPYLVTMLQTLIGE